MITTFVLAPSSTHPARAIVPELLAAKESGQPIENVVADRGYTKKVLESFYYPPSWGRDHPDLRA